MDASVQQKPYHTIGRWGRGRVRPITLTPRDLDCLYALFTHGVLSSDMLRALVAPEHSQRAIGDRLSLMRNPPNEYIDQPEAQQRSLNSYRSNLVYEINERGVRSLVDSGRIAFDDYVLWNKLHANFKPQHFDHDRAAGYVLASIELGAREAGLKFISWREIINRPRCPEATREFKNPLAIPYEMNGERHSLVPDALFGLQYPNGACFFALEIDMSTEQHKECDRKSVTLRQKFRAYRTIKRKRLITLHFGLPSLHVLIVTPGFVRKRNMMDHAARVFEGDAEGSSRSFLFKAVAELGRASSGKPPISGHMLTIPWDRSEYPQLNLAHL